MKISLEIVAREEAVLDQEIKLVKENFPEIGMINIPDLLRFDIRSWEGCVTASKYYKTTIPHLRAIDFNLSEPFPLIDQFRITGINEVLIVQGDPPQDMKKHTYPTTSIQLMKKLKHEIPGIKVYTAIDPYRNSFREEFDYIREKIEAGTDGFMTQPFFDMRLLEIYAEALTNQEVWWGVSPVTGEKSRDYWITRNRAYFPADFIPNLEWNIDFARKVYHFCKANNSNFYLMPIKTDMLNYLSGIFTK